MDVISLELGLVFLVIFMIPVLYVIIKSTSAEKRIKKIILSLCEQQNLRFRNLDLIGNIIVGMDESFNNLVFSHLRKPKEAFQIVPVHSIKACAIKTKRIKNKTLEFVELELIGPKLKKEIVFYEEKDESIITDAEVCLFELQKWEKVINKNLKLA